MKKAEAYSGYELGPIRPPSEAASLLVRITRNCPWNRCTFCALYKNSKFSLRPVEHVLKDIDQVHRFVRAMREAAAKQGRISQRDISRLAAQHGDLDQSAIYSAYNFYTSGMRSIFLQDANSLIIKPDDLLTILHHLQKCFPEVERITSYARSHTIARISDQNLKRMFQAGLNRIHIGLESGSDKVLKRVRKGVDKATQIKAGQKVKQAGIQLSEYFMPGLGGSGLSRENAIETADALNQINPDFIRLRTLGLPDAAPITKECGQGDFSKMGEVDTARELLLLLENLEGISSTIKSDHVLNLFYEVEGVLPRDKQKMMAPIQKFLTLSPHEQMVFCIGRRTHSLSRLSDLDNPVMFANAERTCHEMGATPENMDRIVDSIMKRFI
jgi:biotin synthase-like enzyme